MYISRLSGEVVNYSIMRSCSCETTLDTYSKTFTTDVLSVIKTLKRTRCFDIDWNYT